MEAHVWGLAFFVAIICIVLALLKGDYKQFSENEQDEADPDEPDDDLQDPGSWGV
jgi:hypothetical protein